MMTSVTTTQHNIKHRVKPNDAIYTPKALVKLHFEELSEYISPLMGIDPCLYEFDYEILDPCAGDGAYTRGFKEWYANHLKEQNEKGCKFDECYNVETNEITQGKDFFKNENVGKYGLIIGNLPFSLTEKFLIKSAELKPDIISYLMPIYALTPARIEMMKQKGYELIKVKQFKWYVCMGMCCFATWFRNEFQYLIKEEKGDGGEKVDFTYDRTVWYKVDVWAKKKAKQKAREEKKAKKEEEKRIKKLNALRKRVAKSAASIGKKKHKKWWCESQGDFSKVKYWDINRAAKKNYSLYAWDYRVPKSKDILGDVDKFKGRKFWKRVVMNQKDNKFWFAKDSGWFVKIR